MINIPKFFFKFCVKLQVWLKSENNNREQVFKTIIKQNIKQCMIVYSKKNLFSMFKNKIQYENYSKNYY